MGKTSRKKDQIAEQIHHDNRASINSIWDNAIAESRNDNAKTREKIESASEHKNIDYFNNVPATSDHNANGEQSGLGTPQEALGTGQEALGNPNTTLDRKIELEKIRKNFKFS